MFVSYFECEFEKIKGTFVEHPYLYFEVLYYEYQYIVCLQPHHSSNSRCTHSIENEAGGLALLEGHNDLPYSSRGYIYSEGVNTSDEQKTTLTAVWSGSNFTRSDDRQAPVIHAVHLKIATDLFPLVIIIISDDDSNGSFSTGSLSDSEKVLPEVVNKAERAAAPRNSR